MSEQMKRKIGFRSHDDEDDDEMMDEELDMAQMGHVMDLGEYLQSMGGEEMPPAAPVIHFKPVIKIVNCNCCKKHKKKKKK